MNEQFNYPTSKGNLRSVDEFRAAYLPAYHDLSQIGTRMQRTLDLMQQHLPDSSQTMLDYGCGIGTFVFHAAHRWPTWTISGWDGDDTSITVAKECFAHENVRYERQPYDSFRSLESEHYDVICLLEVIEHVDNPGEILSNLVRALRARGSLVISTPNAVGYNALRAELHRRVNEIIGRRPKGTLVELMNSYEYDPTTHLGHVSSYSVETLTTLLKLHGLRLKAFDVAPLSPRLIHRSLPETLILLAAKDDQ